MATLSTRRNGVRIAERSDVKVHAADEDLGQGAISIPTEVESDPPQSRRSSESLSAPPAQRGAAGEDEMRTLRLVRHSRTAAVWLTVGIAAISFVLSFTSLRNLAAMSAWPGWPSWLWPLILDGLIILATLGIVSFAPYREQFWNRVFLWAVLGVAALVSVGGNALHAWLFTGQLAPWMRWGAAGLACVPPIALMVTTHILGALWRFHPATPPDERWQLRERAFALAVERMDRWEAAAGKMHEEGYCPSVPTEKLAQVLRYLYESRPALSLRAIGAKPEVGLHHDTVGKIRDAAAIALGMTAGDQ
ncbi:MULTISPECIES: DUF2637 domain-containing protein [unclassified Mycobacterium]|uniref:DUF2637 domain-containing protein n=1 Tax=unclassified Mycobacterium TaxID=2642494 RepID=UPI0012E7CC74|nr:MULTISPECIES: DUF2637 domain-containing protein [unclassified Mycobacterium]